MASILFLLIFLITYTLWSYCVKTWKEELKHTEFLEVLLVEKRLKTIHIMNFI